MKKPQTLTWHLLSEDEKQTGSYSTEEILQLLLDHKITHTQKLINNENHITFVGDLKTQTSDPIIELFNTFLSIKNELKKHQGSHQSSPLTLAKNEESLLPHSHPVVQKKPMSLYLTILVISALVAYFLFHKMTKKSPILAVHQTPSPISLPPSPLVEKVKIFYETSPSSEKTFTTPAPSAQPSIVLPSKKPASLLDNELKNAESEPPSDATRLPAGLEEILDSEFEADDMPSKMDPSNPNHSEKNESTETNIDR